MIGFALPLQRALVLTEEEALALLEMCALTLAPERQAHHTVVSRIGGLCREFGSGSGGQHEDKQDPRHEAVA